MIVVNSIREAGKRVREIFRNGLNGTTYFVLRVKNKEYLIRVSDHSARSANNKRGYDDFFSFISNWNRQDSNMKNEWTLDEDGDFTEEFKNVEECLNWHIE